MPSLFGITPADLQAKLVPVAHEDEQSFTIGDDGDLSTAAAEEIIAAAEEIVLSRLPKRYRQLCRAVDGEILVARAVGGELTLATGLAPLVPGSLRLWKNFPDDRVWSILEGRQAVGELPTPSRAQAGRRAPRCPLARCRRGRAADVVL
jgi:hypothetical protein